MKKKNTFEKVVAVAITCLSVVIIILGSLVLYLADILASLVR